MDEPLLRPQCSVCSVTYTRNCTGSLVKFSDGPRTFFMAPFQKVPISGMGDIGALKLRCEDKEFVKLKLEWVKKLWIYQNDHPKDYGCGLTLIFEDKKFVLKPDFVNNLWIKSNYEKNITVIEIESEMFARKNFKPLSVGSTLTGEKNGLNINTILETFQANLLKCGGEINDKPDGLIPPQFSICYVESEYRKTGTGSFVNIEFPLNSGIMRYLFMTAFHVVQICLPDEVTGLKLKFGDNTSTIGNVNLTPDWVKMLCAFPNQMDVFVIEFSQTAMKILSGTNFASLPFACPQINESIFVYQYPDPNGGHVVGIGTITSITSVDNYGNPIIEYQQAHTEVGSSGSPVLNKDFKVVGIHCGTSTNDDFEENKIQYKGKRHATRIDEILKVFKEKLLDRYGGNEKLLIIVKQMEWFEQIPKSALHFIGSGSYGNAYKITVQGGLYYVVKTIEKFGGLDKYNSQVAALTNEFKVITALQNHKLSNWKEFVRDDNKSRILIIMEYLVGGSLFDKIKNYGRLNKTCSLKYLIEILEGLEFLHQQEKPVFHSNLKPSNILFTADDHIKLCDFGIYSVTPPQLRQDCYYMSPERINEDPPSAASDMWSLGVTFVVMATGHTINHTENRYHIVNQLIADFPKDNTKISIEGVALNKYLESLNENDYRRMIISKTLCSIDNRSTAHNLLELCQTQEATIGIGYE